MTKITIFNCGLIVLEILRISVTIKNYHNIAPMVQLTGIFRKRANRSWCTTWRNIMVGRIENYIHSDSQITHKGGAIVKVTAQTDFAARTLEFIQFVQFIPKYCYACGGETWNDVIEMFPELEDKRIAVEKILKETIQVSFKTLQV
jgi:hypothetical protein